jgi:hypothetical protein
MQQFLKFILVYHNVFKFPVAYPKAFKDFVA